MRAVTRLERARSAGPAIVDEAVRRNAELIVIGAPRRGIDRAQRAVFGRTVDYVLKHAPCRVIVAAARRRRRVSRVPRRDRRLLRCLRRARRSR